MNTWEGQKVRLRWLEPEDWEIHYEWNHDPDMPRNLHYVWFPQSRAAVKKWCEEAAVRRAENDNVDLVIETLAGEYAGFIGVQNADHRNGTFKYGIAVRPNQQRKGYASEAIRLVARHYFVELRYQKVIATVYSFNEASIRLHEQIGFQLEGRLRRMIYSNGQYHDELIYGLTDDEFHARYTQQDQT
jgi:RimJ/RimL family protein N-acetyltransferase